MHKIRKECHHLRQKTQPTVRDLSHMIGLLSSTSPAISFTLYRGLQHLKHRVLRVSSSCKSALILDGDSQADLRMWEEVHAWNGKPIIPPSVSITLTSDASTSGWRLSDRRSVDFRGESGSYQCSGSESCFSGPPNIGISSERSTHTPTD